MFILSLVFGRHGEALLAALSLCCRGSNRRPYDGINHLVRPRQQYTTVFKVTLNLQCNVRKPVMCGAPSYIKQSVVVDNMFAANGTGLKVLSADPSSLNG